MRSDVRSREVLSGYHHGLQLNATGHRTRSRRRRGQNVREISVSGLVDDVKTQPGLLHPASVCYMPRYATYARTSPGGFLILSDHQFNIQEGCVVLYRTIGGFRSKLWKLPTDSSRFHNQDFALSW